MLCQSVEHLSLPAFVQEWAGGRFKLTERPALVSKVNWTTYSEGFNWKCGPAGWGLLNMSFFWRCSGGEQSPGTTKIEKNIYQHQPIYLPTVCLPTCLSIYPSIFLSIHPSVALLTYQLVNPSISQSIHQPIHLCITLSIYRFTCLPMYIEYLPCIEFRVCLNIRTMCVYVIYFVCKCVHALYFPICLHEVGNAYQFRVLSASPFSIPRWSV